MFTNSPYYRIYNQYHVNTDYNSYSRQHYPNEHCSVSNPMSTNKTSLDQNTFDQHSTMTISRILLSRTISTSTDQLLKPSRLSAAQNLGTSQLLLKTSLISAPQSVGTSDQLLRSLKIPASQSVGISDQLSKPSRVLVSQRVGTSDHLLKPSRSLAVQSVDPSLIQPTPFSNHLLTSQSMTDRSSTLTSPSPHFVPTSKRFGVLGTTSFILVVTVSAFVFVMMAVLLCYACSRRK